jgi:hypothetical protein
MRMIMLAFALAAAAACGNSSNSHKDAGPADAPAVDAPMDASCFMDAQTHYEIINACTNAQQIFINGNPPLEGSNGTLPPLP